MALRPMVEVDLATVADLLPDDLELDPAATTYPGLDTATRRSAVLVLALAFGRLEAQCAITSAWRDNDASPGVSRALGYQPNGQVQLPPGRWRGRRRRLDDPPAADPRGLAGFWGGGQRADQRVSGLSALLRRLGGSIWGPGDPAGKVHPRVTVRTP